MSFRLLAAVVLFGCAAQASLITFTANLSAANEVPPNASPAKGFAIFTVDNVANTIGINATFSGLTANDTAAHIHCCVPPGGNAGVATVMPAFSGFPLGVTSGAFNQSFSLVDPAFYNPAFITANGGTAVSAEAVLLTGMSAGQSYFNIHTSNNPGGEIRGFLVATPEPSTFGLVGLALIAVVATNRRLRRM